MRKISDTISRLEALRGRSHTDNVTAKTSTLLRLDDCGANPGNLGAWFYLPNTVSQPMPLVVVLHGCTQNARDYDRGAGWSQLADELGFALLFPEQSRANNSNLCFNWYETSDNRRGAGEPASIKQMIGCMIERHEIDPSRVFINGLSAGGAMTSVMLATYPEMFVAGAIIAGLPYGSAIGIPQAFDRMRGHGSPDGLALAKLVRAASPSKGPWPLISVWHGDADYTVAASNGDDIIEQWRPLHGARHAPDVSDMINGYPHRVWHDRTGRAVIQDYRITGMGHGTPLSTTGADACGVSGAHMLEVAISSTRRMSSDWGLGRSDQADIEKRPPSSKAKKEGLLRDVANNDEVPPPEVATSITRTIENALRSAGLM